MLSLVLLSVLTAASAAPESPQAGAVAQDNAQAKAPCASRDYQLPIAWWARPADSPYEWGYYVGGGLPFRGEPRYPNEGTWGWDYLGWTLHRSVRLNWSHGCRYQGGPGKYDTNLPR
jgi:hypothetical protein